MMLFWAAAHMGTDGGFGNLKLTDPLSDAIISHNSLTLVPWVTRTTKMKLFSFPQFTTKS